MRRWFLLLLAVGAAGARAGEPPPLVALVVSERSAREVPREEADLVQTFSDTVAEALKAANIPFEKLSDADVEAGRLKAFKAAVFPYNPVMPDAEQAAVEAYVRGGGRIVVFYTLPPPLGELLGIRILGPLATERRGEFATIELQKDLIQGLPARVRQNASSILRFQPLTIDALVVGDWLDPDGLRMGEPALIISPRGAYMGCTLMPGDAGAKGRLLLALLGRLVPELWQQASAEAIVAVTRVGPLARLGELTRRVEAAPGEPSETRRRPARRALVEARRLLGEAVRLARAGLHADAIETADQAGREAVDAFALSSSERRGEFRAVWLGNPYGVGGRGWRDSARCLADNGFNTLLAHLLSAGLAWHPSKVLPVDPGVKERGDQVADALRWCKECGVGLHVWKTCYDLSDAPDEFVAELRAEGRLQRGRDGSELKWLCPSDPRNAELERLSLIEVVQTYDVAGIQLDCVRYPSGQACFCEGCQARFEAAAGVKAEKWPDDVLREPLQPRFEKWRQEQVTALVRAVAAQARRARPGLLVSAAVWGDWETGRIAFGQDWRLWLQEGLLDFVCPRAFTAEAAEFESLVARQVEWVGGMAPLVVGVGARQLRDAASLLDQLERARRLGADGFACFRYDDPEFLDERLPALAMALTAHPTAPPLPAPRVVFGFPPGLDGAPCLAYAEGMAVTVLASLRAAGNCARAIRSGSGRLGVETTDGVAVVDLGSLSSGERRPLKAVLRLRPGAYRLVAEGKMSFGWLSGQPFVVRSRPFVVVGRRALPALRPK